jgi:hypothetical protein
VVNSFLRCGTPSALYKTAGLLLRRVANLSAEIEGTTHTARYRLIGNAPLIWDDDGRRDLLMLPPTRC